MRGMRETVIFQLGKNGALCTPFIRILCILPLSAILFLYYLSIKKRSDIQTAYWALTVPLLGYFLGYSFLTVPGVIDSQSLPHWLLSLKAAYPPMEFVGIIFYHWDKTLYYVFCEAWGSFTLVILFWQIANENYTQQQAARYYPIFSMLGGVGIIISALLIKKMGSFENITQITAIIITIIGIINLWLVKAIFRCGHDGGTTKAQTMGLKKSIRMRDGVKLALSTPHILYITLCIISFSVLCNVYENAVRNVILNHYGREQDVFRFWGNFFFGKGVLVITANLISKALLQRLGWFYVAITTPIISIISIHFILSIPSFSILRESITGIQHILWALTILLQLNFAAKYAFFDPTKEMAYIPLSDEQKTYGKTVADGMGSRVGNITSGVVQSGAILFAAGTDFNDIAPILLFMCSMISFLWIWAIRRLNGTYSEMTKRRTEIDTGVSLERI